MNKLMIGSAVGFVMGVGLMMTSAGSMLRKDVRKGMGMARQMMKTMEGE